VPEISPFTEAVRPLLVDDHRVIFEIVAAARAWPTYAAPPGSIRNQALSAKSSPAVTT
jgi:hypothetical protein